MSDVVVIGAGIIGAACARSLAAAGLSVTVVDRGSSAGGTSAACEGNLLVSDKGPGPELDLARLAATRWPMVAAELAAELGVDPHRLQTLMDGRLRQHLAERNGVGVTLA